MFKELITKAAKLANGRDRSCASCPLRPKNGLCQEAQLNACTKQFIKGFRKGAKWYRQHLWHKNGEFLQYRDPTKTPEPKSNQPLLLRLDNDRLVIGKFEDGKFSFTSEGDEKVIEFIYLKDLL